MHKLARHIFGIPTVLTIAPLHSVGYNDQNEVKHEVPLVPALLSCDVNNIISVTLIFSSYDSAGLSSSST